MISICLPVFNGETFLPLCLDSIVSQTEQDFELIVCDDHSTDRSRDIILQHNDPRLRYYQNYKHLGLVGNWNRCLELVHGDYILIFHQDDVMRRNAVQCLYEIISDHPEIGFVFSNVEIIDQHGKIIAGHWTPAALPNNTTLIHGQQLLGNIFHNGNIVPCQTVMVRQACYQQLGGFDSRLCLTPDLEMWLRLAGTYDAAYSHNPLIYVRQHPQQTSNKFDDRQTILEVWRAFWIYFSNNMKVHSSPAFFKMATEHLIAWSGMMIRTHLRAWHIHRGIRLVPLWLQFQFYRRGGLAKIPGYPQG